LLEVGVRGKRRCLRAAVASLGGHSEQCLVHGGGDEHGCSGGSSAKEIPSSSSRIDRLSVGPTVSVGSLLALLGPIDDDWLSDDKEEDDGEDDDGVETPATAPKSAKRGRPSSLGVRTISVEGADISVDETKAKLWVQSYGCHTRANCAPSAVPAEGLFSPRRGDYRRNDHAVRAHGQDQHHLVSVSERSSPWKITHRSARYSGRVLQINDLIGFLIQAKAAFHERRENLPSSLNIN
jgi:hypothetical protein